MVRAFKLPIAVGIFLCAGAFGVFALASAQSDSGTVKVRWLMAHTPTYLYDDAAQALETSLRNDGSALRLQIMHPEDVGLNEEGDVPYSTSLDILRRTDAELSSVYVAAAARDYTPLAALGAPFVFEHSTDLGQILEGPTAQSLIEGYSENTDMRALALTLSGGFRVIASREPVSAIDDLRGLRVGTSGGTIAEEMLRSLGAVPVPMDLESGRIPNTANVDAIETTYTRISSVLAEDSPFMFHILDTGHSLFLTSIIVSDSFYDSLSETDRAALKKAAMHAAAVERDASIALAAHTKQTLVNQGRVVELSDMDASTFRAAVEAAVIEKLDTDIRTVVDSLRNEQR